MGLYVQYGCGLSAPEEWENFDSSPTLRLQKIPFMGKFIHKVNFPSNVIYGDIVNGLPGIAMQSCDGIYCSHVLEHLSLKDFRIALYNTLQLLKPGGIFRCVLPDLEFAIDKYITERANGIQQASVNFVETTMMGIQQRPKGLKNKTISLFGNSHHLWMWDKYALKKELEDVGFKLVRSCSFNDSTDQNFIKVEESSRFICAIAFEAIK